MSKQPYKRIKTPTSWKLRQTIVNSILSGSYISSSSVKFTTTWNYSFWRRRREVDDEILSSRLRTDFHVTSGRRRPCRRRGCLSSLLWSKPRRQRHRGTSRNIAIMRKTTAMYVRYKNWYILWPLCANSDVKWVRSAYVWERKPSFSNFLIFLW